MAIRAVVAPSLQPCSRPNSNPQPQPPTLLLPQPQPYSYPSSNPSPSPSPAPTRTQAADIAPGALSAIGSGTGGLQQAADRWMEDIAPQPHAQPPHAQPPHLHPQHARTHARTARTHPRTHARTRQPHPPIHPSTHPPIHPSTHPSIHPSIHPGGGGADRGVPRRRRPDRAWRPRDRVPGPRWCTPRAGHQGVPCLPPRAHAAPPRQPRRRRRRRADGNLRRLHGKPHDPPTPPTHVPSAHSTPPREASAH